MVVAHFSSAASIKAMDVAPPISSFEAAPEALPSSPPASGAQPCLSSRAQPSPRAATIVDTLQISFLEP
ncbi:hypothetical protein NL676_001799 [Syzygium grande]|nr:hypothetical protein NL676_001799 [Syzygium grande]